MEMLTTLSGPVDLQTENGLFGTFLHDFISTGAA